MGNYRKSRDRKRPWREVTWSELCSAHARLSPAFFSYYSSRKCNTVVSTSTRATVYHCLPEIALSLVIYPFPAILFSWGSAFNRRSLCIYPGLWLALYGGCINLFFSFFFLFFFISVLLFLISFFHSTWLTSNNTKFCTIVVAQLPRGFLRAWWRLSCWSFNLCQHFEKYV
jgi:hypothetical protein